MRISRAIRISEPLLCAIRNNFRALFLSAINDRKRQLYNRRKGLRFNGKGVNIPIVQLDNNTLVLYEELGNRWWELERSLRRSILICPLCNSSKKNMIYNIDKNAWFCEDCNPRLI